MSTYLLPALFALFVWWFSTGAIIYLDNLPRRTFRYSMVAATLVSLAALVLLVGTVRDTSLKGAYLAFACGVFVWGWQEISFYMGYVTGPRSAPCPEGCGGWRHFGHAIETSLYHEIAILISAAVVGMISWGQPNQIGLWTFMVLWWMHQSAKLNVFLGVRNLNEEFLPEHLAFLKGFLTKKPMNLLFPVSITVSTVICALLAEQAFAPGASPFARVSATFIATMMALAILEHWMLVLPIPAQKLWSWGLSHRKTQHRFEVDVVAGFLGAGKTTYMRRLLASASQGPGRTIVLVNDFASVGVDGSLLAGQGADVVELPNGCICCSLKNDLARQLQETVARWQPERVLIEPSGVADLASLLAVLHGGELQATIRAIAVTTILDAGAFLNDFARMGTHLEAQMRLAGRVVVNKADLVTPAVLRTIFGTVQGINPEAEIAPARFGLIDVNAAPVAPASREAAPAGAAEHDHAGHDHGHDHATHAHGHEPGQGHAHAHHDHDHDHDHHHHPSHDALGLKSWTADLAPSCDADQLQTLLSRVVEGGFGEVERVKGVARSGDGWIRFDVAGGRFSMAAFAPAGEEQPRVVAIGRHVDEDSLTAAFAACAA